MQLGLWIEIRPADDLPRTLERVAAMGFAALHAHFPAGCDQALARRVARAAAGAGLFVAAISGYANPLRPDEAPMGATLGQLAGLVELMPALGAGRLVSWSGTLGPGLLDDHPDNQAPAARAALRRSVEALLPLLEAAEARLLLEPFFTHTLREPGDIAAFCAEVASPALGVVLDPPNLLPPARWPDQTELIWSAVATLAPYVGLVHLKDMDLKAGALDLPGPGRGRLDYKAFMGALRAAELSAPLIVEHVSLDQAPAARSYVLRHLVRP